jgi:DNA-binding NtrC family response regulator
MSVAEVIEMPRREPIGQDEAEPLKLTRPEPPEPLAVIVERHIQAALAFCGGNKSKTARLLGIDRRTLYRRLEKGTEEECPSQQQPQPLPRSPRRQPSLGRARSRTPR